jgi:hypothetical protein
LSRAARAGCRFELRPSLPLALLVFAAHAVAAVSALLVLPGAGIALGVALVALGAAAAWRRALLRGRHAVRALELGGERAVAELASGERFEVEVSPRRLVGRRLVILSLGKPLRRSVLVTHGMLEPDAFRRLRIWALWDRLPVAAPPRPDPATAAG